MQIISNPAGYGSTTIIYVKVRESLSELSELLERGERQGIFSSRMPPTIERAIREDNLRQVHRPLGSTALAGTAWKGTFFSCRPYVPCFGVPELSIP
jgi:hypothetical protein